MAETTELTQEEKLQAERKELDLMLGKGLYFDLERTIYVRRKGIMGYFSGRIPRKEPLSFHIDEPTLSTLDRMAREQVELSVDEKVMQSDEGLTEAKHMSLDHAKRMARILAIAVMGEDYLMQVKTARGIKYVTRDTELNDLAALFFNNIKPSRLRQLVVLVNAMGNYGDFCNSIRLMSASRTTMPILVEENKKD